MGDQFGYAPGRGSGYSVAARGTAIGFGGRNVAGPGPAGAVDFKYLTIKDHFRFIMKENPAAIAEAAAAWYVVQDVLATTAAGVTSAGSALRPDWNSSAADAFFQQVGATAYSMDEWSNVAAQNAATLFSLSQAVEGAKKRMMSLFMEYQSAADALMREEQSLSVAEGFRDAVDLAFGSRNNQLLKMYTKRSLNEVVNPLATAYSAASGALGQGTEFRGPRGLDGTSAKGIVEGSLARMRPGAPGGMPGGVRGGPGGSPPAAPGGGPGGGGSMGARGPAPAAPTGGPSGGVAIGANGPAPAAPTGGPIGSFAVGTNGPPPAAPTAGPGLDMGGALGELATPVAPFGALTMHPGLLGAIAPMTPHPNTAAQAQGPGNVPSGPMGASAPTAGSLVPPGANPHGATPASAAPPLMPGGRGMAGMPPSLQGRGAPGLTPGQAPVVPPPVLPGRGGSSSVQRPPSSAAPMGPAAPVLPGRSTGSRPPGSPNVPARPGSRASGGPTSPNGTGAPRPLQGIRGHAGSGSQGLSGAPVKAADGLGGRLQSGIPNVPETRATTSQSLGRGLGGRGLPELRVANGASSGQVYGADTLNPAPSHAGSSDRAVQTERVGEEELFTVERTAPSVIEAPEQREPVRRPGPALGLNQ